MKTYSKRRRLAKFKVDPAVALDAGTNVDKHTRRGRIDAPSAEDRPSKKRKSTILQTTMDSTAFVTPHPTKEARDQAYKLPSTKPIPSPYHFSPVPKKTDIKTSQPQRPILLTTSLGLKENNRNNRYSSKTLSSFTLTSGSGPLSSHRKLSNEKQSRSRNIETHQSRSPPVASHPHSDPSNLRSNADKLAKSNANRHPLKELRPKSSSTAAKSITHSALTQETLLASPFASRASSPVASKSGGIVATKKADREVNGVSAPKGQGRAKVLKSLSRSRRQSEGNKKRERSGAHSSPEKSGKTIPLLSELFYQKIGPGKENNYAWKNRRPSAPSNLQRPSKYAVNPQVCSSLTGKAEAEDVEGEARKQKRSADGVSPVRPKYVQVFDDDLEFDLIENHDSTSWMLPYTTDFNRPPSQMSMADVCLDPGGGGDESTKSHPGQKGGFDVAWTSTPFKDVLARNATKSVITGFGGILNESPLHHESPGMGGEEAESDCLFLDRTPWITDSIVSPPTPYLQCKDVAPSSGRDRRVEAVDQEGNVSSAVFRAQNIERKADSRCPLAELSVPAYENVGSAMKMKNDQEGGDSGVAAAPDTGIIVEQRRTRSGTILGPQRRTRTGTIVGRTSTTIGRSRSGTVTPNGSMSKPALPLAGIRRTRNGTIIGPLPDLTSRNETGAIGKLSSSTKPPARNSPDEDGQGVLDPTEAATSSPSSKESGEQTLEEVEELEYHADSLYVPRLVSSPDPIDFLRFGNTKEENGAMDGMLVDELQWCVADEPPSPDVTRKKTYATPGGDRRAKGILADRTLPNRRGKFKAKRKCLTRFMVAHGQVENLTREDGSAVEGDDSAADDELLLVEGQSLTLFV